LPTGRAASRDQERFVTQHAIREPRGRFLRRTRSSRDRVRSELRHQSLALRLLHRGDLTNPQPGQPVYRGGRYRRAGQRGHYPGTRQSQLRHQPQWRCDPFTFAFQPGTPGSSSMMLASPPGKKSMTALPVRTTAGRQPKVRPAIHPSAVLSTTTMVTARPIDWRKAQQINSSASTVRNGRSDTLVWQVERGRDGISWKSIY